MIKKYKLQIINIVTKNLLEKTKLENNKCKREIFTGGNREIAERYYDKKEFI